MSASPRRVSASLLGLGATAMLVVAFGACFSSSASAVGIAPTTTALTSSANPAVYGQSVTLTAVVAPVPPATAKPTGTVTFFNGTVAMSTKTLSNGTASYTTTYPVGAKTFTATYNGDTTYAVSTSPVLNQAVNPTPTATTLVSSPNPSNLGSTATFTATTQATAPGAGVPSSGTVKFYEGTTLLATKTPAAGIATFAVSTLTMRSHPITAVFGGSASYLASTSPVLTHTVTGALTTTGISAGPNPSTFGGGVTITATVGSLSGSPGGTVTFLDGTTPLGTGSVSGGQASITTANLAVGGHTITAEYSGQTFAGSTLYFPSTSAPIAQTVDVAPTTTTITASPNPSIVGTPVTLAATVTSSAGAPTGIVTFTDGGVTLGTASLANGTATLSVATLPGGSHPITAAYAGDGTFGASASAPLTQTVNAAPSVATISSSANPATFPAAVDFTVTVTSPVGTPTGTVVLFDGATTAGAASLTNGTAVVTVSNLGVGTHTVTATYSGTADIAGSSTDPLAQVVNAGATTTTLTAGPNPVGVGNPVTLTATVGSTGGSPTGTVTFLDGGAAIGTAPLASGSATVTVSDLAGGTHSLTATYAGDASFDGSTSAPVLETVNASTTTALVSGTNPSVVGGAVTFTATVTTGGGTPTGAVTFRDGATDIGTATLSSGTGSITVSTLSAGNHTVTASYSGDAIFGASSSPPLTQAVTSVPSSIAGGSTPNPSIQGQTVTLSATVTGVGGPPTGLVTFFDDTTNLGSVPLANGAATLSLSNLAVGSHSVIATYAGDATFGASVSAPWNQTVDAPASTSTTVTASINPSSFGDTVGFTVAVSAATGTPTGSVTLTEGATTLGTTNLVNGTGTITVSTLGGGTHSLTVSYGGDAVDTPSVSAPLSQVVNPTATSTALTASANPTPVGATVTYTATVASFAGTPGGSVALKDGPTVVATASIANGQASFAVSNLAAGSHSLVAVFAGTGDYAASTSAPLTEVVLAPTTTTIGSTPNPTTYGQSATFTATVTSPSGTPTGSVHFFDGATDLGSATVTAGQATLSTSALSAGSHPIVAGFSGDPTYGASTSAPLTQTVNRAASTSTLVASPIKATLGQAVGLTATVTATGGTPTGSVTFRDGATTLGAANLTNGQATFATNTLAIGTHSVTATYAGDANFLTSATTASTVTVIDAIVYVDKANPACKNTGAGAGTVATPFCAINSAAAKVAPGQTVQVAAGTYAERIAVAVGGAPGAPVTFAPAPGASVTVTGGGNGFALTGKTDVTIRGFTVNHTTGPGITVTNGANITIDGNHVSDAGMPVSGSTAQGIKLSGTTDSSVVNNTTDHNSDAGIYITSDSNNDVVADNESFANARGYVRAAAGIDLRNSTGDLVYDNRSHDNEDSGINVWTGLTYGSSTVYDNVTYANGDHGIDVHNSVDAHIVANTVYRNSDSGIEMTTSQHVTLNNNVSVDNGINSLRTAGQIRADAGAVAGGCVVNDDLVFLTAPGEMIDWNGVKYTTLAAFRTATGMESRGIQADPLFASVEGANFHLLAGSPAIDSANTGALGQPAVDYDGNGRTDDPSTVNTGIGPIAFADRGAFEYRP